jgi:hypothetical protein
MTPPGCRARAGLLAGPTELLWGGERDVKWIKRMLAVLVIGFVLFYLVNQPEGAAAAVRGAAAAVGNAINSLITFFNALAG